MALGRQPFIYPKALKNLYLIFYSLVSLLLPHLVLSVEEEISKPTAIFSALFWEKYVNKTLVYRPWANEEENNSTKIELAVGSNGLSRKFTYYGRENLKFYEKQYFSPRAISLMSEEEKKKMTEIPLVAELPFSAKQDEIQEFILLFMKDRQTGRFKIYPLPFSQSRIPFGSYQFISQAKEELNFTINQERMELGAGGKKIIDFTKFINTATIRVTGYRQDDGQYKEFFLQNFSNSNSRRGYVFFSPDKKRIKVTSLVENNRPIESAVGYGAKRSQKKKEEDSSQETLPATSRTILP